MFRFIRPLLLIACLVFVTAGCKSRSSGNLIVLHTGRLLGNAYPLSMKGSSPLQYYPYLVAYVKKVRQEAAQNGQEVLLVDLGDGLRGSFAAEATDSANMIEFYKTAGYDAIILGNLDDNVLPPIIQKLAPITVLCPFVKTDGSSAMPGTAARATIRKGDLSVNLVANFYGDADPTKIPERFPSYYAGDWREVVRPVRDYSSFFEPHQDGKFNLLSWFKFEPTDDFPAWLEPYQDKLDAVLAHRIYASAVRETWGAGNYPGWKVPVSENILRQNRGFSLARLELKLQSGGRATLVRQELVQLTADTVSADEEMVRRMETFAPVLQKADRTIATLKDTLTRPQILFACIGILSQVPTANAVLYSQESIRAEWPRGELKASQVYEALPWSNRIVLLRCPGDLWERVKQETKLTWAETSVSSPNQTRIIATSTFQAASLCTRFGLVRDFTMVGDQSEFAFFLSNLEKNISQGLPPLPSGWRGNLP
jgi:hypothetical protein